MSCLLTRDNSLLFSDVLFVFFSLICMSSLYLEYISTTETKRKKKVVYWMKGVLFVPLVAKDNWLLTLVKK